jgi:division protein CdvB (Snf7/Vps24/ESCRT-III family)
VATKPELQAENKKLRAEIKRLDGTIRNLEAVAVSAYNLGMAEGATRSMQALTKAMDGITDLQELSSEIITNLRARA